MLRRFHIVVGQRLPSALFPLIIDVTKLDKRSQAAPWYVASPASDAAGLDKRAEAAPWYVASPASDAAGLEEKRAEAAPW